MAQIGHEDSSVSRSGTFGYILLPGLCIGLLLGWAEHLRRLGGPGCRVVTHSRIVWQATTEVSVMVD